jgi:hypothetical protein
LARRRLRFFFDGIAVCANWTPVRRDFRNRDKALAGDRVAGSDAMVLEVAGREWPRLPSASRRSKSFVPPSSASTRGPSEGGEQRLQPEHLGWQARAAESQRRVVVQPGEVFDLVHAPAFADLFDQCLPKLGR